MCSARQPSPRRRPTAIRSCSRKPATFVINPTLYGKGKLPYDAEKDFIPITGLVRIHQALLGHPSVSATNVRELIALARKQTGRAHLWHGRRSAPRSHMNMVLFESMAGLKLLPVHYRGAAPALADLIAGHVSLMSLSVSSALPPFRSGASEDLRDRQPASASQPPPTYRPWPRAEFLATRRAPGLDCLRPPARRATSS